MKGYSPSKKIGVGIEFGGRYGCLWKKFGAGIKKTTFGQIENPLKAKEKIKKSHCRR